ncbi:uncharacterized protein FOMMEDRAFT_160627 [Fomitiporia mediterranea MF3/22]|uniref:uncharacterized protein n=1 Tax=Fomitiporia mediterranea (strain MF3/22) TaxID=694068 RepID=UPI0004407ED8|nr:uncharacterized protein FOMMEDRAFT_160627 [Fomitiporia mediterranea MF3/22]EJC99555.1 hypothetical protein FOMMEDRAFT_160627 [Fomitiporia mediterranea MF3/22]
MASTGSPIENPLGVSYSLLVGPLLIGVVVNALVFGVCVMQLISYFLAGYRDNWKVIGMLSWIYIIDAFQVATSVSMLWHYIVHNFANPIALASSPWEYATLPIFSSLASVPIQHFMAYRIMRFSGSKLLFAWISILSLAQAAAACTSAAKGLMSPSIESHKAIIPVADAWLALSVACDTSITILLLYYLLKNRTGFERTDSIISRICTTTVRAAVPVTVLCILDLCFLTTTPNNNLHYMFALPVGRLYTNTLMSTLNERKLLRSQMENSSGNRGISLAALTTSKHRFQRHPAQVRIDVDVNHDGSPNSPVDLDSVKDSLRNMRGMTMDEDKKLSPLDEVSPMSSPRTPISPSQAHVVNVLPRGNGYGMSERSQMHGGGEGSGNESGEESGVMESGGVRFERAGYGY